MKPDVNRLPKWAQEHIRDLTLQLDEAIARATIAEQAVGWETDPRFGRTLTPLRDDALVRWSIGDTGRSNFDVNRHRERVWTIRATEMIKILPSANNTIYVEAVDR